MILYKKKKTFPGNPQPREWLENETPQGSS